MPVVLRSSSTVRKELEDSAKRINDNNRRNLAEQIMYGSVVTQRESTLDVPALSERQTMEDIHSSRKLIGQRSLDDQHNVFSENNNQTPPATGDTIRFFNQQQ